MIKKVKRDPTMEQLKSVSTHELARVLEARLRSRAGIEYLADRQLRVLRDFSILILDQRYIVYTRMNEKKE